jgi:hypothetical protein
MAGYPLINVPAGYAFGLPVGISLMGTAFSEPTLIKLAHGYEQATLHRRPPEYIETLPLDGEGPGRGTLSVEQLAQAAGIQAPARLARRNLMVPGR